MWQINSNPGRLWGGSPFVKSTRSLALPLMVGVENRSTLPGLTFEGIQEQTKKQTEEEKNKEGVPFPKLSGNPIQDCLEMEQFLLNPKNRSLVEFLTKTQLEAINSEKNSKALTGLEVLEGLARARKENKVISAAAAGGVGALLVVGGGTFLTKLGLLLGGLSGSIFGFAGVLGAMIAFGVYKGVNTTDQGLFRLESGQTYKEVPSLKPLFSTLEQLGFIKSRWPKDGYPYAPDDYEFFKIYLTPMAEALVKYQAEVRDMLKLVSKETIVESNSAQPVEPVGVERTDSQNVNLTNDPLSQLRQEIDQIQEGERQRILLAKTANRDTTEDIVIVLRTDFQTTDAEQGLQSGVKHSEVTARKS